MNPGAASPQSALRTLDRARCLELLASRPVGRLAFTRRALPDVIPVNYTLDGEDVLIRLEAGSPTAAAVTGAVVAFEVDDIDIDARAGWSVTVVGEAQEVLDVQERLRASLRLVTWAGDQRDHLLRIRTERVTGRTLTGSGPGGRS
jgi:nitroimidazol reductase NimA-like FMN-containing flavoprotein (pyridoxamine 5'-phosphate oxidase superfamily)